MHRASLTEMSHRPIVIFICLHFWRKEWWHSKLCGECKSWIFNLLSGKHDERSV